MQKEQPKPTNTALAHQNSVSKEKREKKTHRRSAVKLDKDTLAIRFDCSYIGLCERDPTASLSILLQKFHDGSWHKLGASIYEPLIGASTHKSSGSNFLNFEIEQKRLSHQILVRFSLAENSLLRVIFEHQATDQSFHGEFMAWQLITGLDKDIPIHLIDGKSAKSAGTVILLASQLNPHREILTVGVSGRQLKNTELFGKSDPYYLIYRPSLEAFACRDGWQVKEEHWQLVYRSETLWENLNPTWTDVDIDNDFLCYCQDQLPLKIEVWDDSHKGTSHHHFLGQAYFSKQNIKSTPLELPLFTEDAKPAGKIILELKQTLQTENIVSLIKKGVRLSLSFAIDFTASNGDPESTFSLHHRSQDSKISNPYELVIKEIAKSIFDYRSEETIHLYGFGAKITDSQSPRNTEHFFRLRSPDEELYKVATDASTILKFYNHAFSYVELAGPTKFEQVVSETSKIALENWSKDPWTYTVLVLITDGCLCDVKETIAVLEKEASKRPVSYLIVGVGDDDFLDMPALDNDKKESGEWRDCVQFIDLKKCTNPSTFRKELLAELADQMVEYYSIYHLPSQTPSKRHVF